MEWICAFVDAYLQPLPFPPKFNIKINPWLYLWKYTNKWNWLEKFAFIRTCGMRRFLEISCDLVCHDHHRHLSIQRCTFVLVVQIVDAQQYPFQFNFSQSQHINQHYQHSSQLFLFSLLPSPADIFLGITSKYHCNVSMLWLNPMLQSHSMHLWIWRTHILWLFYIHQKEEKITAQTQDEIKRVNLLRRPFDWNRKSYIDDVNCLCLSANLTKFWFFNWKPIYLIVSFYGRTDICKVINWS